MNSRSRALYTAVFGKQTATFLFGLRITPG
jgi:hypothetical protein